MNVSWSMPWLLLIALQPFIIFALRFYLENKQLNNYTSKKLLPWALIAEKMSLINNIFIRNTSYVLAWILFAVAAAGPRIAEDIPAGISHTGQDVVIVLDISQSMHATDIKPTRLKQARLRIKKIVAEMNQSRIGIIVYAAKPHLYVPLSYDKNALNFYIRNLSFLVPPSQGSKPVGALKLANNLLSKTVKKNSSSTKSIILITDTDATDKVNAALKKNTPVLSESGIPIYVLSMANEQGEAIPAFKEGWVNKNGRPIITRPNYAYYQSLSDSTNGLLVKYSVDETGVDNVIKKIKSLASSSNLDNNYITWHELFYWFLTPGIAFLFISMFPYQFKVRHSPQLNILLLSLITITLLSTGTEIQANQDSTLREAHRALLKNNYVESRELYSSIDSYQARYGEAVSYYRLNDYPRAIRLFEQAVLLAKLDIEFSNTLYNLGNSYFQAGNYKYAIKSFEGALLYKPNSEKIIQNMIFSKRALQAVEDRAKLLALTARAGQGSKTARAADNIEINENNNVSLDSSNSENIEHITASVNHEQVIPEFIVLKGLEFAKTSSSNNVSFSGNKNLELPSTASTHQLINLHDNQPLLWKRIFELEEGYPAPLSEPEVVPGVSPW